MCSGWKSDPESIEFVDHMAQFVDHVAQFVDQVAHLRAWKPLILDVLIFVVFYTAVSNQTLNIATNGWVDDELERTWKEAVVIRSRDCIWICLYTDCRAHGKPHSE